MKQAEAKEVVVQNVGGLEIETSDVLRAPNAWNRLENWDLFVPGAIRKIAGLEKLNDNQYDSPIVAFREWRRTPTDPARLLGLSTGGVVYDLQSGVPLASFPPVGFPFVALLTGLADGASTPPGTSNPAQPIQYVVTTTKQVDGSPGPPMKWDGTAAVPTVIGVSVPTDPIHIPGIIVAAAEDVSTDPIEFIYVQVSRQYAWTWWNSKTKHESSRSPVGATSTIDLTQFRFLQQYPRIREIQLNVPVAPPPYGDVAGYDRKRIYATRDGGSTFFLVQTLYDATGTVVSDDDGAVPLATSILRDGTIFPASRAMVDPLNPSVAGTGFYVMTTNSVTSIFIILPLAVSESATPILPFVGPAGPALPYGTYEGVVGMVPPPVTGFNFTPATDDTLVDPSPDVDENNPPPTASFGATYQGRLWLISGADPATTVFSKIVDPQSSNFESFSLNNRFTMPSNNFDPIVTLVSQEVSLLVGKKRSINVISGTSFTDFTNLPLDPQIGMIGRRNPVSAEGRLFFYSEQGIERLESGVVSFDGHLVRPLTDGLDREEAFERLVSAVDKRRGIVAIAFAPVGGGDDSLILYDLSQQSPFSQVVGFDFDDIWGMENVLVPGEAIEGILIGRKDRFVYRLFRGRAIRTGVPTLSIAETQELPQDDPDNRKVFRRFIIEVLPNFRDMTYEWSIDDAPYSTPLQLRRNNFLGGVGRQISILLKHQDPNINVPTQNFPVITGFRIEYVTIGESR